MGSKKGKKGKAAAGAKGKGSKAASNSSSSGAAAGGKQQKGGADVNSILSVNVLAQHVLKLYPDMEDAGEYGCTSRLGARSGGFRRWWRVLHLSSQRKPGAPVGLHSALTVMRWSFVDIELIGYAVSHTIQAGKYHLASWQFAQMGRASSAAYQHSLCSEGALDTLCWLVLLIVMDVGE
jgi:hypothetical protein